MIYRIILTLIFFLTNVVLAAEPAGVGRVAQNLLEPVSIVSDFVNSACIVIGVSCLFATVIKYMQYRKNPMMTPLSTVILLLVMGIMLLFLPLISRLPENGIL